MPYTALQTLGWLARCSKWERAYNINRAFRRRSSAHVQRRGCGLLVCRKKKEMRFRGHGRAKRGLVVVFKTAARNAGVAKYGGVKRVDGKEEKAQRLLRGHLGCGGLDCRVCGVLFGCFCADLEALGGISVEQTNPHGPAESEIEHSERILA